MPRTLASKAKASRPQVTHAARPIKRPASPDGINTFYLSDADSSDKELNLNLATWTLSKNIPPAWASSDEYESDNEAGDNKGKRCGDGDKTGLDYRKILARYGRRLSSDGDEFAGKRGVTKGRAGKGKSFKHKTVKNEANRIKVTRSKINKGKGAKGKASKSRKGKGRNIKHAEDTVVQDSDFEPRSDESDADYHP